MTPERWQQVKSLCQLALDRDPGEREAFLARCCQDDDALRAQVESLLQQATASDDVLDSPIWDRMGIAPTPSIGSGDDFRPTLPHSIGRYRIIRVLGEGGMGTVYEAEQDLPRRRVALKVIKTGLSSPELVRRFERESQALARLQHPGIAQVYEAGTADTGFGSQPYFAMEFIQGEPLKEYVTGHQQDAPARLELVARICDAVQHAHERGIIHRDLKPGNILVDRLGQPKILDFGVARLVGSQAHETLQTNAGDLVGTLAYMSPEQILADPAGLDPRSDVYSIGVLLYELLAGRLPYNVSGRQHEAAQAILEEDPDRLSTTSRYYKGDIETIVAKTLEKDKTRRYESASALAADLRRYLANEPIAARPASAVYQLQKFARRHRSLVAGVVAAFTALTAGTVVSTWQALRARSAEHAAVDAESRATTERDGALRERNRALAAEELAQQERNRAVAAQEEAQRDRSRAVAAGQRAETEASISKAVSAFLQSDLLAQASAQQQAGPDSKPDPDLKVRTALDRAAARVDGRFRGQPLVEASVRQTIGAAYQDLGLYAQAREQFERTLQLRRDVLGTKQILSLETLKSLAQLTMQEGKYPTAEALYLEAIHGLEQHGESHPSLLEARAELAGVYLLEGRYAPAEALTVKALEVQRRLLGPDHPATLGSLSELGRVQMSQGNYPAATVSFTTLLEGLRRVKGAEHPDTLTTETDLAQLLMLQVKYGEAEALYKTALEGERRVLGREHPYTVTTANGLAVLYKTEGKYAEAEPLYLEVLEIRQRIVGKEHPDTLSAINNLGALYVAQKRYADAEPLLAGVLATRKRVLGPEHPNTLNTMVNLAQVYIGEGHLTDGEPLYADVLSIRQRVLGAEHPDTLFIMNNLGFVYTTEGKLDEAEQLLTRAREVRLRTLGAGHPNTALVTDNLAHVYLRRGQTERAKVLFAEALDARRSALGPDHVDAIRSQSNLAEAYREAGDVRRGEALLEETLAQARAKLGRDNDVTLIAAERLAETYRLQGKHKEAQTLLAEALDSRRRVLGPLHPNTIEDLVRLGLVLLEQRQYEQAETILKPIVSSEALPTESWFLYQGRSVLGAALTAQGRFAEAEQQLVAGYEGLVKLGTTIPAESKPVIGQTADRIVALYRSWGKQERAAQWADRVPASR